MIFRALVALQVLLCLLRLDFAWGRVVNRTIDDTFGDSETQRLPLYLPTTSGVWKGASCSGCAINPDVDKAFKNTYQAATYAPDSGKISITLAFNGTAIWVFFILANNEGDGITTITDVNFAMDGENTPTNFRHAPDLTTREPLYNQLVYNRTDMPFGTHALEIFADADFNVYVNFDYAIYTHDDDPGTTTTMGATTGGTATRPTTTSTSGTAGSDGSGTDSTSSASSGPPVGAIAGGVVGGVLALAAIILLLFCLRRQRRKQEFFIDPPPPPTALMSEAAYDDSLRPNPFIQENAFQRGPSSSGNEPLYSPVAVGMRNHSNGSPSMNSGSQYSGSAIPYGGVARAEYDSDRATSVTGGVASIQGSMPSTYTQSSTGVRSEKRRRQQGGVALAAAGAPPSSAGADRLSTAADSDQQERVRRARQAEIGDRLRTVEREMNDLKRGRSVRDNVQRRVANPADSREDEIADMREEMRRMQEEIMLLRSNQASEWAQGLTDEPPPGYTARPLSTHALGVS